MQCHTIHNVITVNQPMVMIPAKEYELLLREAGFSPTPKLDHEISDARHRFKKGKTVSWKSLKDGFKKVHH